MLRRTFLFLPGIGEVRERRLWREGFDDWDKFMSSDEAVGFKGERKERADDMLREASRKLKEGDLAFFSRFLRPRDSWRLWSSFGGNVRFLDIETMGLSRYAPVTVVGVYDGREFKAAVRGFNLDGGEIRRMLEGASMIVTFNGTTFDLPVLENHFPGCIPEVPHLDLRYAASRIGLRGGLKHIELQMGIKRPDDVMGMSGEDAVRLWRIYERDGNENALKLILKYNREDIVNLEPMTAKLVTALEDTTLEKPKK